MNGIKEKIGRRGAALCMLFLTLVSCGKAGTMVGEEIRFEAESEASLTKTAYGSVLQTYGGYKQRIDWVQYDTIRIVCAEAYTSVSEFDDWADYRISQIVPNSGLVSVGRLAPVNDTCLLWSDNTISYNFYALYPSPAVLGRADVLVTANEFGEGKAGLYIPDTQRMRSWTTSGSDIIGSPDMRYAFMYAATRKTYGSMVSLTFNVLFSAIQFRIGAGETSVQVDTFKVRSSTQFLAGNYDYDLTPDIPEQPLNGNGNLIEIAVPLVDNGHPRVIPARDTLDITVFVIPLEHEGLTISFTGPEIGTRSLELKYNSGESVPFPDRYTKYRISGLSFPTNTRSQVEPGTKSPIQAGNPVDPLEDGRVMRDGVICLNMADEKYNHEWY